MSLVIWPDGGVMSEWSISGAHSMTKSYKVLLLAKRFKEEPSGAQTSTKASQSFIHDGLTSGRIMKIHQITLQKIVKKKNNIIIIICAFDTPSL